MEEKYIRKMAGEMSLAGRSVGAVVELLDDGSSVPFIARYRKEATGSLDEVVIANGVLTYTGVIKAIEGDKKYKIQSNLDNKYYILNEDELCENINLF